MKYVFVLFSIEYNSKRISNFFGIGILSTSVCLLLHLVINLLTVMECEYHLLISHLVLTHNRINLKLDKYEKRMKGGRKGFGK